MLRPALIALWALAGLPWGCDRDSPPEAAQEPAAQEPPALPSPTASAGVATSKPTETAPPAGDTDHADTKDYPCGEKGEPPCPMQGWMKTNIAKSVAQGDTKAIARQLTFIAEHPVEGYGEWVEIAETGAKVARTGDLKGAKEACKTCHKRYVRRYKKERRDSPWP